MTVLASWRQRLARAVERGDPRLALGVGLIISVLSAWAFAAKVGPARRAEDAVMDEAFKRRPPIRESADLLLVDKLDQTYQELATGGHIPRQYYAQAVLALDRLGAREIVFDVEFKSAIPRPHEYDSATGEFRLDDQSRMLRQAIGISGKVVLGYHLELRDPLALSVRARFDRIVDVLRERFTAGAEDVAAKAGVDAEVLRREFYGVQREAAVVLAGEMLAKRPSLTFAELRDRFLPGDPAREHPTELKLLHYAYWVGRGMALLPTKGIVPRSAARPSAARPVFGANPPLYPFLEFAKGAAATNADPDADGVLRRPMACYWYQDRPHLYLGLAGALWALGAEGGDVEAEVQADAFRLSIRHGKEDLRERTSFPNDETGRFLVNWAGNRTRARGRKDIYFEHVAFHELVSFFAARYDVMDENFRRAIAKIAEETGEPYHPEYVRLSDRLKAVFRGDADLKEARPLEVELDRHRQEILAEIRNEIATIERVLPTITAQRARENSEKGLRLLKERHAALRLGYDREEALRPRVAGKVCWIGSASTAGGDLHSTPLGPSTPGVDALANVANMALTGQVIRQVPAIAVFAYLVAVGLGVSLAVSQWKTSWAALATLGGVALALLLYGALFAWGSILFTGAGPVGTAIFSFAGVTAFKELVTERSRRKLEKELEKNTSAELVEILMEHPELLRKPRKMVGTFFFSDIKSFTSISEKMEAEVLFPFVNRYLDRTTRSLKRHRAYLDKYIGDGIMALFGIPVASDDHARNACLAAIENQALLVDLNLELEREGLPRIKVRIGINSGEASAGYVGAEERSDYTVLGDAVNLASRLEGANKEYGTSIMVSEFTRALVASEFVLRELDRIRVVGKENAVGIYELVAPARAPLPFPEGFLEAYASALALFRARRWDDAIDAFGKALALRAGDRASELYIGRAQTFLVNPPPPDWEGVFELSSK